MILSKVNYSQQDRESYFVEQSYTYVGDDYWNWSVWIEADDEQKLDKIESVTYQLHPTFATPVQIVKTRKNKFRLNTSGWGTFTIYVVIDLKDESVIELKHDLVLEYPDTPVGEGEKQEG